MKTIILTMPDEVDTLLIDSTILTDTYPTTRHFYTQIQHVKGNTGYVIFPQDVFFSATKVREDMQDE